MKSPQFKDVHEGQKLNHLPGTFNIGRKDRLWKNYQRLRLRFGKDEFSFLPRTFLLPSETKLLRRVWEKRGCRAKWIVKPPALARGTTKGRSVAWLGKGKAFCGRVGRWQDHQTQGSTPPHIAQTHQTPFLPDIG